MKIAFYAPLKPPGHPTPSGDRAMARQIRAALSAAGHEVALASDLRAYVGASDDAAAWQALQSAAGTERDRLAGVWGSAGLPDLWLCYHPYYKSPDLLGPPLCAAGGIPYVTVECSYSARRNVGVWADMQSHVLTGIRRGALHVCLTTRDRVGLQAMVPEAAVAMLPPFLDLRPVLPMPEPFHLVTVAMMRPGDKLDSYRHLARALTLLGDLPWTLSVAGDGAAREAVMAAFAPVAGRIRWTGRIEPDAVPELLANGALFVWPGCGEAYGLAYLEAQAAGLPVVAFATAGVPEVVESGVTGLLTPDGDVVAFAAAIRRLLTDDGLRTRMAAAAQARVEARHSLVAASRRLDALLRGLMGQGRGPWTG